MSVEKNPEPIGPPYKADHVKRAQAFKREFELQEAVRQRRARDRERENARHCAKAKMPWHG